MNKVFFFAMCGVDIEEIYNIIIKVGGIVILL